MIEQGRAELLTVEETARRLGVSTITIRRHIRDGSIPAVRLGYSPASPLRIPADTLVAWLYEDVTA